MRQVSASMLKIHRELQRLGLSELRKRTPSVGEKQVQSEMGIRGTIRRTCKTPTPLGPQWKCNYNPMAVVHILAFPMEEEVSEDHRVRYGVVYQPCGQQKSEKAESRPLRGDWCWGWRRSIHPAEQTVYNHRPRYGDGSGGSQPQPGQLICPSEMGCSRGSGLDKQWVDVITVLGGVPGPRGAGPPLLVHPEEGYYG